MVQEGIEQAPLNSDVRGDAISERAARADPASPPEEDNQGNDDHDSDYCGRRYQDSARLMKTLL